MDRMNRLAGRTLFLVALALAGLAVWEKLANMAGFRLLFLSDLRPSRLLELGAFTVLFSIALELREIRQLLGSTKG
jgi:hypothetical protein